MKKKKDFETEELRPYEDGKLSKIPKVIVVTFLKYWAAAAAVFFILIGGIDIGLNFSEIDGNTPSVEQVVNVSSLIIFAIAATLAVFFTYIVRPIIRLINNRRNNTFRYNMVNFRGILSLFVNFIYMYFISFVLFFAVVYLSYYKLIPNLLSAPNSEGANSGIEPFSYGLLFIILDSICVFIKNVVIYIYNRVTYTLQMKEA